MKTAEPRCQPRAWAADEWLILGWTALWPLAERRRLQQAAVGPQCIQTSRKLKRGLFANVTLKNLTIVADLFDNVIRPVCRKTKLLPKIVADTEQALDFRLPLDCRIWSTFC